MATTQQLLKQQMSELSSEDQQRVLDFAATLRLEKAEHSPTSTSREASALVTDRPRLNASQKRDLKAKPSLSRRMRRFFRRYGF